LLFDFFFPPLISSATRLTCPPPRYDFTTGSDCEVIIPIVMERGVRGLADLDGVFAFVLYDSATGAYLCGRDAMGVNPLYRGTMPDGALAISSELKALMRAQCVSTDIFPPGHWMGTLGAGASTDAGDGPTPQRWYEPRWLVDPAYVPRAPADLARIREALTAAVSKRLMADVTIGVLLSGGLDSSLVASIATRLMKQQQRELAAASAAGSSAAGSSGSSASAPATAVGLPAWSRGIPSFSIGLKGSPDLAAARKVADFLGTSHYGFEFTIQEGLDAVRDVIEHIETYDVTTIRASTPMYLLSRRIKAMGVKVVLSGEGADECAAGYLYFAKAPNGEELHRECVRKLDQLHLFDCLRANKSTMAWGLEARCPFLDKAFLDVVMETDPDDKLIREGRIEKHIIRAAFDDAEEPYLPREVLFRCKEQFSDGVGYGWIDALRDHAEERVSDRQFARRAEIYPHNVPATKEAFLYRSLFEGIFPGDRAARTVPGGESIACSTPAAIAWDASFRGRADPSGRAIAGVHPDAYK
jgi:asparagine synthase (glutamine-hydrolysing)